MRTRGRGIEEEGKQIFQVSDSFHQTIKEEKATKNRQLIRETFIAESKLTFSGEIKVTINQPLENLFLFSLLLNIFIVMAPSPIDIFNQCFGAVYKKRLLFERL